MRWVTHVVARQQHSPLHPTTARLSLRRYCGGPGRTQRQPYHLKPSMKATREYQKRTLARSINEPNVPIGSASRLWIDLRPGDRRHRVDDISKQFTGAGWKNMPQELVDEILGYILGDLDALKACSLVCKHLFGATRPLIHQRLLCLDSRPEHPEPKKSLFSRFRRDPRAFGRLIDADRSGVLRYTRHLTFKPEDGASGPRFNPRDMRGCVPHLRSITKLHGLTLDNFHLRKFAPVFNEHFGMFANTLRHLDIRRADYAGRYLLRIICEFPLLEDLTIVSPASEPVADSGRLAPMIKSPSLRGTLVLAQTHSTELYEGLVALPGGLHFHSLELFKCGDPQAVFAACKDTVTSISYFWLCDDVDSESNFSTQVHITM